MVNDILSDCPDKLRINDVNIARKEDFLSKNEETETKQKLETSDEETIIIFLRNEYKILYIVRLNIKILFFKKKKYLIFILCFAFIFKTNITAHAIKNILKEN